MVRKRHNEVMILGVIFLLLGLLLFFLDGKDSILWSQNLTDHSSANSVVIVRDSEGPVAILDAPTKKERINHNAADDPAFKGTRESQSEGSLREFLGLYDADPITALKIIFLAAGGILLAVSYIKVKS